MLYTFSRVLDPYELDNEFFAEPQNRVPLDPEHKEVLAENLDWQDFVWSDFRLQVKQKVDGKDREVANIEPLLNYKLYTIRFPETAEDQQGSEQND